MRKVILAGLVVCSAGVWKASAQQEPQFTHYMFNKLVYNPAYAGIDQNICANFIRHDQYTSFKGIDGEVAPKTMTFDVNGRIPFWIGDPTSASIGVGAHYYNDVEQFVGTNGVFLDGSYRFNTLRRGKKNAKPLPFDGEFSVGLSLGMLQKSLDADWKAKDMSDPRLPGSASSQAFDAGLGVYYSAPRFYVGLSALHLPGAAIQWEGVNKQTNQTQTATYNIQRVFFATAGYHYWINKNRDYQITPSILLKNDMAKTSFAVNAMFTYKQKYWGALNYRVERLNAASVMLGLNFALNQATGLKAGYSFDIPTKYMPQFGPTHEIYLGICYKPTFSTPLMVPPHDPRHLGHDPY